MMATDVQTLELQIATCVEGSEEHAALLTELAESLLAQGNGEEANTLFQQVFNMRLRDLNLNSAGIQESTGIASEHPATSSKESSACTALPAAVDAAEASSSRSKSTAAADSSSKHSTVDPAAIATAAAAAAAAAGSEEEVDGWDEKSDDWEPDLTVLRTAGNFEGTSNSGSTPAAPLQEQQQQQQRSWGSQSEPSTSARPSSSGFDGPSWRQGRQSGRSTPSRPRGRGESKCGVASDSDTEWDVLLTVPNQPHIVEFYGLNRGVKTTHLEEFLLEFMWGDTAANVKWVDDEHALAVFPCTEAAQALLDAGQKQYKVRPYAKASGAAWQIPAEALTPPRSARPKTTAAVAKRLISNALGNREVRDRAAEKELADLRKANKQGRQQRQQQLDATWGDDD